MSDTIASDPRSLRVVNETELTREQRDEIVWRSILSFGENARGEGVHDPEIWARLQSPEPADVFVQDTDKNIIFVAPHLGLISLLAS